MSLIKKFKEFLHPKSLGEHLAENMAKYLEKIDNLEMTDSNIWKFDIPNSTELEYSKLDDNEKWLHDMLNKFPSNTYQFRFMNGDEREIFLVNSYSTFIHIVEEVDQFKDTKIYICKPVDLKMDEIVEAFKSESGYLWEHIEHLMFHTFNDFPKWKIYTRNYKTHGNINLLIDEYDLEQHFNDNPSDKIEFDKYINYIRTQLEYITVRKWKVKTYFKTEIVFTLDCPYWE